MKQIPYLKSALDDALSKCSGTPVLIDSGSIIQTKENLLFYKQNEEGVSPAMEFLFSNNFNFSGKTYLSLFLSPERLATDFEQTGVSFSLNDSKSIMVEGVEVSVVSYLSDKGFRYLDQKTVENWKLKHPFTMDKITYLKEREGDAGIKIVLFSEYDDIQLNNDDLSEMMVFFHKAIPSLNIFFADSKDFDSSKNLRESLIIKTTAGVPSVTIINYSAIKESSGKTIAILKNSLETLYLKDYPADKETVKIIEPYLDNYLNYQEEKSDPVPYDITCSRFSKQECFLERLYSETIKQSAQDCAGNVDFIIHCSIDEDVEIKRGSSVSRKEINRLFPDKERGVVIDLSWDQIFDIMNSGRYRNACRFLSMTPFRYRYNAEGEFVPSRVFMSERMFKVAMTLSLFKEIDYVQEHEDDICISSTSPGDILFNNIGQVKVRYFFPFWTVEADE